MTNLKCVFIFVALNVVVLSLPLPGTKRNQLQTTANSRSPLVHDYTVDLFECWKAVRSGKAMNEQKQTKCEKTVGVKTPSGVIATAKSITTISPKNVTQRNGGVEMLFNVDNLEQSSIELKLYKRSGYPKMNVPETCSHHNTGIKLLLSVGTTTMQLASSVVITNQDIQDGKWIGFGSLSKFFKNIQHTVKVSIEGRSMCNNQIVDLNKIGVFDGKEMMAVLVMYSHKSDNMRQAMDKVVVADRTRRNAGSGEASLLSPSLGITAPCRLVKYNFSLAYIPLPANTTLVSSHIYEGNICSGHCLHPIPYTIPQNFHSALQARLSLTDSNVPLPCCAPTQYETLHVILRTSKAGFDKYQTVAIHNATALNCGCF